ncbi:MAG: DUF6457 domain-containing protein [Nitriliruptorales bacterium]
MSESLARLAEALSETPLTDEEVTLLLDLARDVAHGSERKHAPLSTFLVGLAVGSSRGTDRLQAIADAAARVRDTLPEPPAEAS